MTALDLVEVTDVGTSLLRQGSYWKSRPHPGAELVLVLIDDMTPARQRRLLEWLRSHAETMAQHERRQLAREWKIGKLDDRAYAAALHPLDRMPAAEWMENTTLVRRLVQLVPHEPLPARGLVRNGRPRRWWWGR